MTSAPAPRAILIAGPTASGKSALALEIAAERGGIIVNADSMQVYRELAILTARPTAADEAIATHRLYGHVPAARAYSVGQWLNDVRGVIDEAEATGRVPVIVGGTGLYFMALLAGLSPIPEIPFEIRSAWRARGRSLPAHELHRMLVECDPETAARTRPSDRQRVIRALEVIDATGRSLAEWQRTPGKPLLAEAEVERLVVEIERGALYRRCDDRFDRMMEAGALEEVCSLGGLDLSADLPAMRALGVAPLLAHLGGEMALDDAVALAKRDTRHYVRRQATWLARNMITWIRCCVK